jgi:sulfatase modifying factor 1
MQNKITLLAICALLISASSTGFKSENKALTKLFVYVPEQDGQKGFYISSTEITNKQYRDFLNDLSANGETEKLHRAMVDSSKWATQLVLNEPYKAYYFRHPAYDNYPVVNITKEGASLYCGWLTEKYNATAKAKVRFALPTEEQWTRAAQGGDASAIYPWKGSTVKYEGKGKWNGQMMGNFRHKDVSTAVAVNNSNADVTAPSLSFMPNAYGVYNMAGNVSELLADKDYTKGGSYISSTDKVTIASKEEYGGPAGALPTVGFRPVMIITGTDK